LGLTKGAIAEGLQISLLGKPIVKRDGVAVVGFISAKAQALLFYLVATHRPHTRNLLAGLLWSEMPDVQARKNLRNVLSNLNSLLGPHLLITRDEAAFNADPACWIDIEVFQNSLAGNLTRTNLDSLHNAVELYQGDFLDGFYADGALAFEEWAIGQRAWFRDLMVQTLHTLVVRHLEREENAAGINYARRLLSIEPWREETHRHLMLLLTRSRQRSAALAQYEACRRILAKELGVEVMPETTALYRRIQAAATPPPHNLPPQLTPFIGREAELAQIASFLNTPQASLLTLSGPGGIGKTRLALQAALRCADPANCAEARFSDGIFLVSLSDTEAERGFESPLITALAQALAFSFNGPLPPQAQLLSSLRHKEMLLILDNFEVLPGDVQRIVNLIRLGPGVKLLVTSRVRLNLHEEWLLEVKGLDYPQNIPSDLETLAGSSAVALFIQEARRVQAGFRLTPEVAADVVRICRLVEGMPLGLELAANWLRVLSCAEIANEIQRGLDFLTTAHADVPEYHRSLRAVFDYSWNALPPAEQVNFRQLAVFRDGFEREAAADILGISLPILVGLMDRSLLRRNAQGRYEMHDFLRQYVLEKLQACPAEYDYIHDRLCHYYAEFMARYKTQLHGDDSAMAMATVNQERENVRLAWDWAMSHRRVSDLETLMDCI
jgi:DNA-binding SARP family transcriptional activator/predicted ATPase